MGDGPSSELWRAPKPARGARAARPKRRAIIDKFAIVPVLVCIFAAIISPLEYLIFDLNPLDTRLDTRIFWPVMAAVSIILAAQNRSRLPRPLPPHIICFFVYLAFAGTSVLWSFNPRDSFVRFTQEAMIVTSIVLPAMLSAPTTDLFRGLFLWCFVPAAILNVFFVMDNSPAIVAELKGYPGYFLARIMRVFSDPVFAGASRSLYPGRRRALGIVAVGISVWLLFWANSKTAFGLTLLVPGLAGLTLVVRRMTRLSPAIILMSIPVCWILLASVSNFGIERLSYMLYGNSSLTGAPLYGISRILRSHVDRSWVGDTNPFGSQDPTRPASLTPQAGSRRCRTGPQRLLWIRNWSWGMLALPCSSPSS